MTSAGLRATGLTVRYGVRTIVDDLTLDIRPGRIHGLIGPNGTGKSTLVKALLGLVDYQGTVRVGGIDLRSMNPRSRARHLAYLAQHTISAADFTGRQLVELGRYARRSRFAAIDPDERRAVQQALRMTGADKWAERPVAATSGGERQLTGLARALAQDAPALILDEPVSALDMTHQMAVLSLLRPWLESDPHSRLVLVVLHDLSLAARFCDDLVLLAPGPAGATLAAQGRPDEVLTPRLLRMAYGIDTDIRISPVTGALDVTPL
ncbi:ABC transporter ATP-binding protein [Propionimicrobium sp. PCR01-08-3]|uniref:ABC transporter ATP-binding protein n=1 Tax=Propionimicrobium sp. PCR01-08-3 TaxID=3052086 RepID=UPI00255C7058|nr:ABC transporter ATP-binding protein [Propionimicrobium sp. PCR01-08-3]WIY83137.1 ABC transporter ATP-binding protein [Propionimicrobium sp. PCR01-08-3]